MPTPHLEAAVQNQQANACDKSSGHRVWQEAQVPISIEPYRDAEENADSKGEHTLPKTKMNKHIMLCDEGLENGAQLGKESS
eukprot:CAMPEP_0117547142 /NCGR_PEP_ID=MMETSP0784-20121206/46969_1 /TAXON_ID=39447 /ORGANISM="" /LENGTH=81 /DNA_ID=CAMNT_0005344033 /DNA_START=439 /DNA_END=684 /DNA_ORIENTATION=-